MSVSQNGWTDIADYGPPALVPLTVHGVTYGGGIREGDVHTVLNWFLTLWAAHVEAPIAGECWGYGRPAQGDHISNTNHYSGTAADTNASKHPRGADPAQSFTSAQIATGHNLLKLTLVEGVQVIRWGADYAPPSEKDGMHHEINTDAAHVRTLAEWIAAGKVGTAVAPAAPAKPADPQYESYKSGVKAGSRTVGELAGKPWSAGDDVKELQRVLNAWYPNRRALALDGLYGPLTLAAVKYLQGRAHITVDGICGPQTWKVIGY